MSIDPSKFHPINVADTCAVWNALSSKVLYAAASGAGCIFCVTSFVEYELLVKPRKSITPSEQELIIRLRDAKRLGNFETHSCTIADLQSIARLESRKSLGKGELSSIAFAMKTRQAFILDNRKATALASDCGHSLSQTTPHLFAWLVFNDRLGNSDKSTPSFLSTMRWIVRSLPILSGHTRWRCIANSWFPSSINSAGES